MSPLGSVVTAIQNKQDAIQMAVNSHGPYGSPKPVSMMDRNFAARLAPVILSACGDDVEKALEMVRQMPVDYVGKWRFDVHTLSWVDVQ